jgi:hypothetical protein
MINIKELYNKFVIKLQESFLTVGSKKRIQLMLHYIDIGPSDVLLDVGGNTGKITEVYARGKTCACRIRQNLQTTH